MFMIDEWNFKSIKVKELIINKDNIKTIIEIKSIVLTSAFFSICEKKKKAPNDPGARFTLR